MKLFTHNFLTSTIRGVSNGYPLIIHATKISNVEMTSEYSHEYAQKMASTLIYPAFVKAVKDINKADGIPEELPDNWKEDESFVFDLIFCLEIVEGELECPESGRKFPIRDSIPNMLLNENEI